MSIPGTKHLPKFSSTNTDNRDLQHDKEACMDLNYVAPHLDILYVILILTSTFFSGGQ